MRTERSDWRRSPWLSTTLRSLAVLIAIAAIIDPSITTSRRSRPLISLVATEPHRDSAVLRQARDVLRKRFTVIDAPLSSASGTVLVGSRVPTDAKAMASPVVVLTPTVDLSWLEIRRIEAPSRALLQSRVTVDVSLALNGLSGMAATRREATREVVVELAQLSTTNAGGDRTDDALVVSRERVTLRGDSVVHVPLTFVPSRAEAVVLQVRASIIGAADTARSDLAIDVRAARWSVLFFDRRPSWMSTFVRRAIEGDPRFVVTSRVITSTNVSRETGRAPESLDAIAAASRFDAVVIGAPDVLTERDVRGIDLLLRSRGASVLLVADNANAGPADRLTGFGGWRVASRGSTSARVPLTMVAPATVGGEPLRLKGRSVGVPMRLPDDAQPIAVIVGDTSALAQSRAKQTVMWRVPVGLGSLVVSGAFDAWRYRDSAQSTFNATWRDLIERAASDRQPALDVQLSNSLVEPRKEVSVAIGVPFTDPDLPVRVALAPAIGGKPLFELPVASRDSGRTFIGSFRAPSIGSYQLRVSRGSDSLTAALVVATSVSRDAGAHGDVLEAWAKSRGGRRIARNEMNTLPTVLGSLIANPARVSTWHPMRSAWWIVPFALALAAEWWIRRRRGQP